MEVIFFVLTDFLIYYNSRKTIKRTALERLVLNVANIV